MYNKDTVMINKTSLKFIGGFSLIIFIGMVVWVYALSFDGEVRERSIATPTEEVVSF